jgi:hypothetical protein
MTLYDEDLLDMLDQARALRIGVPQQVECNHLFAYEILDEEGPYMVSRYLNHELEYTRGKKNAN